MGNRPLAGYTVGITAERRREELGAALERHGAQVVYGPAIRVVPLADDTELRDATRRCLMAPLDYVIATTAAGFSGWLDAAHGWGLGASLHAAIDAAQLYARGPKVRGAVRANELRDAWSPPSESTAEMLEQLLESVPLAGRRIAIQLHGEPLPELVDALRGAGAEIIEVSVYRWAPPEDEQPLHRLIEATTEPTLHCVTFTSAPAASNFLRTAAQLGRDAEMHAALTSTVLAAAVGPVAAGPLLRAGIAVVQPDRHRLGALVNEVVRQLPARRRPSTG